MEASDLLLIDHQGRICDGGKPDRQRYNSAAFVIHAKVHHERPNANAVCHSHSPYGKAFSVLRSSSITSLSSTPADCVPYRQAPPPLHAGQLYLLRRPRNVQRLRRRRSRHVGEFEDRGGTRGQEGFDHGQPRTAYCRRNHREVRCSTLLPFHFPSTQTEFRVCCLVLVAVQPRGSSPYVLLPSFSPSPSPSLLSALAASPPPLPLTPSSIPPSAISRRLSFSSLPFSFFLPDLPLPNRKTPSARERMPHRPPR